MTLTTPVDVAIGNGNVAGVGLSNVNNRPRLVPNRDHKADNYDDLGMEFSPLFLSSLERFLPPDVLDAPRYRKYKYMREVLRHYSTAEEPNRVQKHNEYKKKIVSDYKVDYFEKWACETRFRIMRPSTMHRFGVALDDIGMKSTLDWLMRDFICHIAKILFPDVGGCSLDSNHGYVVEYGMGRDVDLVFFSAAFREMKKHRKGFSDNCGECKRERQARVLQSVAARKKKLLGVVGEGDDAS
ncbi:hypothetical protein L1987_38806 [Smallanthus sonchifolius]|uniref:Uncharacterized protein n=1 Tax=Smallanthus sonchifolius TaxID=185202 RepID=A0ACB9HLH1_9ASTR|nr:hypothetical protein L1987_38806 [Smallanthus sonchifolius]